ncbi:MAG: hypothetical protein LBT05_08295 [Planctomycetaceae bacterium]|jgi:hypothetical protein|nr:hypothetical protein [Planctomycetaceae bacterium]
MPVETPPRLRSQVTCPHCWHVFSPDQALWISESPDLLGDSRLGEMAQQRFLPSRFDLQANALDAEGFSCTKLACPHCHLMIPRALFETPLFFMSIVGAPAAGKSYFLASMSWRLRKTLPRYFQYNISDTSPEMNHRLQRYESQQFFETGRNRLVAIEKTEVYGENNNTVILNGQEIAYPQPFLFSLTPTHKHPRYSRRETLRQILCLYDNAGESYLPGEDKAMLPLTRHLSRSRAILFLYDPTQDPRFRKVCRGKTRDPQMSDETQESAGVRRSQTRQELILSEMILRVRTHLGIESDSQENAPPLVVVITKADAWAHLLLDSKLEKMKFAPPWRPVASFVETNDSHCALDVPAIEKTSSRCRRLLLKLAPEFVGTAEQLSRDVTYVPVSATGIAPSIDPATGALGFKPDSIHPYWVEVPVLYTLAKQTTGMIPLLQKREES